MIPAPNDLTFQFDLKNAATVNLTIADLNGKIIATVFSGKLANGTHQLPWRNEPQINSGIYFAMLRVNDQIISKKFSFID